MQKKNFKTEIDHLDIYDGKALVVVLGECTFGKAPDPDHVIRYPDASQETVRKIGELDLTLMRPGVWLLVSSEVVRQQFEQVRLIQKHLAFCYVKFVWFPQQDTSTPDPLGLGEDKGPLAYMAYQNNKLDNLPNLLTRPRSKVLENSIPKCPVLLLAPGPSLNGLLPYIKQLNERFVTLCLSRTLRFCKEHDITPDVVVQLDTHGEQQNFYPEDMDLSQSWLLALSCVPARKYINRFAGVFWIDTFEPGAFKDRYEIRNSWLSSLIPLLGAAELFRPSRLLMAGSDLAYTDTSRTYFNGGQADSGQKQTLTDVQALSAVNWHHFSVRLSNGNIGKTCLQLFVTAYEAETIISGMTQNQNTACYNITPSGILDPAVLEPANPSDFIQQPLLDRAVLHKAMKRASMVDDLPDAGLIKRSLPEQLQQAEAMLRQADALSTSADANILAGNPLLSAGKLISHLHPVPDDQTQFHLSRKILERYRDLLQKNINLFRLNDWSLRGKTVEILCFPDETDSFASALKARFPQGKWNFNHTWSVDSAAIENQLPASRLPKFLHANPVTLISRRYAQAADYLLPLLPARTTLVLEEVFEQPWPGKTD